MARAFCWLICVLAICLTFGLTFWQGVGIQIALLAFSAANDDSVW